MQDSENLVGRTLGRYQLTRLLGSGGMGAVYEAVDTGLKREVAVKILHRSAAGDSSIVERFIAEARVVAQFDHPHIVPVFDFGDEQGLLYFVSPLIRGATLSALIERGRLDQQTTRRILQQVGSAVDYAHARGVIHRDIKPQNILLDEQGNAKLTDFGIAKSDWNPNNTQSGFLFGTVRYMAPEAMQGQSVDHRVDIYALGVVAYEMLSGTHPLSTEHTAFGILLASARGQHPSLASIRPDLPKALASSVQKAMAVDPAERFGTAADFLRSAFSGAPESPSRKGTFLQRALRMLTGSEMDADAGTGDQGAPTPHAEAAGPSGALMASAPHQPVPLSPVAPSQALPPSSPKATPGEFTGIFGPAPAPPPPTPWTTGAFTSIFTTTPELPPGPNAPPVPPAAAAPREPGEFTRMFQVGTEAVADAPLPSAALTLPDVAFTIQRCNDPAFVGRKTNVTTPVFRIGRSSAADLVLAFDRAVSHIHAEVVFQDGGFRLRDAGSSNGIFLNGKRLAPGELALLMFGARIVLGSNTQLVFVSNEVEEMSDFSGQVIGFERFCLKELLHSSAKSSVYLAEDRRLDAEAVIKILSPRMASYPGYREQFKREAAIASKLLHPHICDVIDFGEAQFGAPPSTSLYVAMRHLGGTSLNRRMAQGEPFPVERIAVWLEQLASALDFIHRQSVTHGSIKPSAVVFDSDDACYLTDFAFAATAGDEQNRTLIGTPAYLAPEQWETGLSTPASDLYSLGVLAYLLVTGFLPFENQEDPNIRAVNLTRGPVPAHELAARSGKPGVPPLVSPVLAKMLAAHPEERFGNAQAFAAAFGQAVRAPVTPPPAPRRPLIFISHQRTASGWLAIRIKDELESRGYQVFVDSQQTDTAGRFPRKIEHSIDRSAIVICLLAQGTLNSTWVNREIEYAVSKGKPMIPVFQDTWAHPAALESLPTHIQQLLDYDAVEFRSFQRHQVEASLQWLAESVEQLLQPPE